MSNKLKPYILLFFVNVIFFLPLFYPNLKLVVTPEYGGGDQNILHYPVKFAYQQALQQNKFLFWLKDSGAGYPIFAEQEMGFFDPINILSLKFLPFALAINLQILIYFLILSFGTYFLGRVLKFNQYISFYLTTSFSFCLFMTSNIIHLSHLPSTALIPLIFALTIKYHKDMKIESVLLLIFFQFYQFINGHVQYFYITQALVYFYTFINFIKYRRKDILFGVILSTLITLLLSSFQLFPTLELLQNTSRALKTTSSINSLLFRYDNISYLLTFFNPFLFYSIDLIPSKLISFTPPWEANFYLGFGTLILLFLIFIKRKIIKLSSEKIYLLILLFIFLLLYLGKYSPLYSIFSIPPFSLFQYNERFSIVLLLIILILISNLMQDIFRLQKDIKKTALVIIIVCLINLLNNYHIFIKFNTFSSFNTGASSENKVIKINSRKNNRIYSPFYYETLNSKILFKYGTKIGGTIINKDIKLSYLQDYNLFFSKPSLNLPTSAFNLSRHTFYTGQIFKNFQITKPKINNDLQTMTSNLLKLSAVDLVITPNKIDSFANYLQRLPEQNDLGNNIKNYYYKVISPMDRIQYFKSVSRINTYAEFLRKLSSGNISTALVEELIVIKSDDNTSLSSSYKLLNDYNEYTKIKSSTNKISFLVIADSFYPGWHAYIDGKETKIYRANLMFRGIVLPKGEHVVEFKYIPESFYLGVCVSGVTLLVIIIFFLFKKWKKPIKS